MDVEQYSYDQLVTNQLLNEQYDCTIMWHYGVQYAFD